MRGIDFVKNKRGKKTAVLIDLKQHGQLWEDFYDSVVAQNRARGLNGPPDPVRRGILPLHLDLADAALAVHDHGVEEFRMLDRKEQE